MPKSANQKLKLPYLMKYLLQRSDEQHPVTVNEMIEELARCDISAERKSIYDDLDALSRFGLDIVQVRGKNTGYYVANRDFELPELKLLVDAVQSSKFITEKKTLSLIRKIEGLCSVYEAQNLQRQVFVRGRVKSMNESVYYNVDEISGAINADRRIRFKYMEYAVDKNRRFRHGGALYELSPFALLWDNENYYLLAYDAAEGRLKHYRVDKMAEIAACTEKREGKEAFAAVDMSAYTRQVFGMFSGSVRSVKLRFANHLAGAVIDRFGKDTLLIPDGSEHFTVSIEAVVSPQFFAWVFGFGAEVELLSPADVRQAMREQALATAKLYE